MLVAVALVFFSFAGQGRAQNQPLLVDKNPTPDRPVGSLLPPFAAITSTAPTAAGFVQVADYPARTLYSGPTAAASGLIKTLASEGYHAAVASELNDVFFRDHRIDPDTGIATPPFPSATFQPESSEGLYILVLRGYLTAEWLGDLGARSIRLVEALPPAAFVARGPRAILDGLVATTTYVRGSFSITPSMKAAGTAATASPFRPVLVQAVEESPADDLKPYLDSVSSTPVTLANRLKNGQTTYSASLSDVDIATLSAFENVYFIADVPESAPSSERQGLIALRPATGPLTLPDQNYINTSYWEGGLNTKGIYNFNNTKIALIDTGFDNGTNTHPDFQFNGSPSVTTLLSEVGTDTSDSRDGHGTMTASIITAFSYWGDGRHDPGYYRYGLGLAPGVKLISDKFFKCEVANPSLSTALTNVQAYNPNIVNLSFNDCSGQQPNGPCGYDPNSLTVDQRIRSGSLLFTLSAGNNVNDNCNPQNPICTHVRGPATAKNGIAVGASENFTYLYANYLGAIDECRWNNQPQSRDARHIPSFSQTRDSTSSIVKPDLVAPGTRVTGPVSRATRCFSVFCNDGIDTVGGVTYGMSIGTSFSAPAVAGAAAAVRKWYYNLTGILNPSPALTKAILINGAYDVGGAPSSPPCPASAVRDQSFNQIQCVGHVPDPYQGWGELNLSRLLGPSNDYFFSDQNQHPILTQAAPYWEKFLTVNDGSRPIRITLVYSDAAGNGGSLRPYGVKNRLYLGAYQAACFPCWGGNNFSATTGLSIENSLNHDGVNNVQQIFIPSGYYPTGASFRIYVTADSLVEDAVTGGSTPQQDFAIFVENARQ
jgi:hypothetical protein